MIPLSVMAAKFLPRDRLSDEAVARLLAISKRTLLRWLKNGIIDPPALVIGKQRRWAAHEVTQLLEKRKTTGERDR